MPEKEKRSKSTPPMTEKRRAAISEGQQRRWDQRRGRDGTDTSLTPEHRAKIGEGVRERRRLDKEKGT